MSEVAPRPSHPPLRCFLILFGLQNRHSRKNNTRKTDTDSADAETQTNVHGRSRISAWISQVLLNLRMYWVVGRQNTVETAHRIRPGRSVKTASCSRTPFGENSVVPTDQNCWFPVPSLFYLVVSIRTALVRFVQGLHQPSCTLPSVVLSTESLSHRLWFGIKGFSKPFCRTVMQCPGRNSAVVSVVG